MIKAVGKREKAPWRMAPMFRNSGSQLHFHLHGANYLRVVPLTLNGLGDLKSLAFDRS